MENLNDTTIITGKLLKMNYINKRGDIIPDLFDFYLETTEANLFIKLDECKIKIEELENNINKKVKLKAIKKNGLWDADNQEIESRIGEYISIIEIIKIFD